MIALTILGGWSVVLLVPLVCAARTRKLALVLAGAIGTQAATVWLLKRAVGRVRPWVAMGLPVPFGGPHDGSFPSGHAAASFCVAAFLMVVLPSSLPASRSACEQRTGEGSEVPSPLDPTSPGPALKPLPSVVGRVQALRAHLLGGLAFGLAGLVALSRVALGAHFPSDVCAGAALGGVIGTIAGRLYKRSQSAHERSR